MSLRNLTGNKDGMAQRLGSVSRKIAGFLLSVLLAGFMATLLVRFAPGFGTSEKDLDPRFSGNSAQIEQISPLRAYGAYLSAAAKGDFGNSELLQMPVRALVSDRWSVTLRNVVTGFSAGWALGIFLCCLSIWTQSPSLRDAFGFVPTLLLGLPASITAFAAVFFGAPAGIAVAAVILPRVYRYTLNLLLVTDQRSDVLRARASGVANVRILWNYHFRSNAPQLLALAGVSVNVALGACIPIEVLCDSPGLGHLAWKGAIGRDLNLVVTVTLLVTIVTLAANRLASLVSPKLGAETA